MFSVRLCDDDVLHLISMLSSCSIHGGNHIFANNDFSIRVESISDEVLLTLKSLHTDDNTGELI